MYAILGDSAEIYEFSSAGWAHDPCFSLSTNPVMSGENIPPIQQTRKAD